MSHSGDAFIAPHVLPLLSDYSHIILDILPLYSLVTPMLPQITPTLLYGYCWLPLTCSCVMLWILPLFLSHSCIAFKLLTCYSLDTPALLLTHSCVARWLLPCYSSLPHCSLFTPLLFLVTPSLLPCYSLGTPMVLLYTVVLHSRYSKVTPHVL